MRLKKRIYNI